MAGYLRKYVGIYEVRADYDLDTNDFPRDLSGSIDPSFDDYYINCKNGIKIRHATGSILSCYIPTIKRGRDIMRQLGSTVIEGEVLDSEVYFTFSANHISKVAELCGARTRGRNIQPLSPTTLPKRKSVIPESELKKYKGLFNKLSGETPLQKGQKICAINRAFQSKLPKTWKADSKKYMLDFRGYIYYIDKWNEYLKEIENYIEKDKE